MEPKKLETVEDVREFFKECAATESSPLKFSPIVYHMMTLEEIESLLEFAKANAEKDHRTIVIFQENSVASVIKVADPETFFAEVWKKEGTEEAQGFPDCAKDITDYGTW